MCKDKKIPLLTQGKCPLCKSSIIHLFWFRNGTLHHLKNKYVCQECAFVFLPLDGHRLKISEKERFLLADSLFEETKLMTLLKNVPVDEIYVLKKDGEDGELEQVKNKQHYSDLLNEGMELHVFKEDLFDDHGKVKIFVPSRGYEELYIPIEYIKGD